MSDTTDLLTSRDTQDAPGDDASSLPLPYQGEQPLPYQGEQPPPYQGEQPPPYSAAKTDTTWTQQSSTGYESFRDIIPERLPDTTPLIASSSFDDKIVRRAFVRKVFSILTLQLLFTFSVVCVFTFSSVVKDAVQTSLEAYLSSIIIFLVVSLALSYRRDFSRRHPWNILGLVVVTLSLSYMVGTIASFHGTTSVVITMGVTLAVTVAIIVFSAQFLMIDCQLMMGAMSNRLSPEEYINAALNIYLDVMLIFLYLLGRR
ncbi:hypothetical protein CesoFtcFv8_015429 [Champsocephalus esox]|uniref:Uncharacterized protein n=1 Tax=Champsocephalus esox TaxID=159716 RepID=A0AAN8BQM6_9TELE|nr:hypothetical protein CesoFtcFv8_015429 [Champsocephalus esox]